MEVLVDTGACRVKHESLMRTTFELMTFLGNDSLRGSFEFVPSCKVVADS